MVAVVDPLISHNSPLNKDQESNTEKEKSETEKNMKFSASSVAQATNDTTFAFRPGGARAHAAGPAPKTPPAAPGKKPAPTVPGKVKTRTVNPLRTKRAATPLNLPDKSIGRTPFNSNQTSRATLQRRGKNHAPDGILRNAPNRTTTQDVAALINLQTVETFSIASEQPNPSITDNLDRIGLREMADNLSSSAVSIGKYCDLLAVTAAGTRPNKQATTALASTLLRAEATLIALNDLRQNFFTPPMMGHLRQIATPDPSMTIAKDEFFAHKLAEPTHEAVAATGETTLKCCQDQLSAQPSPLLAISAPAIALSTAVEQDEKPQPASQLQINPRGPPQLDSQKQPSEHNVRQRPTALVEPSSCPPRKAPKHKVSPRQTTLSEFYTTVHSPTAAELQRHGDVRASLMKNKSDDDASENSDVPGTQVQHTAYHIASTGTNDMLTPNAMSIDSLYDLDDAVPLTMITTSAPGKKRKPTPPPTETAPSALTKLAQKLNLVPGMQPPPPTPPLSHRDNDDNSESDESMPDCIPERDPPSLGASVDCPMPPPIIKKPERTDVSTISTSSTDDYFFDDNDSPPTNSPLDQLLFQLPDPLLHDGLPVAIPLPDADDCHNLPALPDDALVEFATYLEFGPNEGLSVKTPVERIRLNDHYAPPLVNFKYGENARIPTLLSKTSTARLQRMNDDIRPLAMYRNSPTLKCLSDIRSRLQYLSIMSDTSNSNYEPLTNLYHLLASTMKLQWSTEFPNDFSEDFVLFDLLDLSKKLPLSAYMCYHAIVSTVHYAQFLTNKLSDRHETFICPATPSYHVDLPPHL